ncbi:hypothetical protein R3P38DRAFT_2772359 [Favolaschia claudopus]|uniref:Uncharacterized protein n=1 Tax=Favolaschia claudopus TaxID=2862362 RepID=A0AAW0C7R4_9AGAR
MFDSLVDPFINPTLSLSEQMIALVKFAHISCALFLKHDGDFFPHQLYGDLQCMVKNMIFKIAHSKVLNPMLKVFLCLLGDDVLEILFGRSRMIGGHSPNHAVDELRQPVVHGAFAWFALGMLIIFLLATGKANSPLECYNTGVTQAKAVLAKYGCDIDFAARFSKDGFDLMRPNGGKYPGLSKEVDRSLGDVSDSPATELVVSVATNESLVPADILAYNAKLALASEEAARTDSEAHSVWIDLTEDGQKKAHKKTILRTLMDPTFDINDGKSHDRLLRVRYYSIGGDSWDRTASTVYSKSNTDDHMLKIHGLFASLILSLVPFDESHSSSGRISWAWITQYVAFESAKAKQASTSEVASRMRHLSVTIDGRLVLPLMSSDLRQMTLEEILNVPRPADTDSEKTWVFTNEQLEVFGRILDERVTEDAVRVKIPVYGVVKDGRYPYEATIEDATTQTTEKISHCFSSIIPPAPKDGRRPCTVCLKNVAGPDRQNHMGRHILLSQRGVAEPEVVMHVNGPGVFCRYHKHSTHSQVAKDYPCGFCGKHMSENGCTITIASGKKASSSCSEGYPFQVTAALKRSLAKPSTNAPLRCSLCTETHWKYNMPRHLEDRHPSWKVSVPLPDRTILSTAISISQEEGSNETSRVTSGEHESELETRVGGPHSDPKPYASDKICTFGGCSG